MKSASSFMNFLIVETQIWPSSLLRSLPPPLPLVSVHPSAAQGHQGRARSEEGNTYSTYFQENSIYRRIMSGQQCCENPPASNTSSGEGSVLDNYGGLRSYVTGSLDSTKAIILISDVFGFGAPNLRMLADRVAATGFLVVVPDFFYGDPYVPDVPTNPLMTWIKSHMPDKGFEDSKPVIAALKSKGVSAIGAAGFCWGGKVVAELSKADGDIKAGVMIHPSLVVVEDIKDVKTPIAILGAEFDQLSPPQLVKEFEDILSSKPEIDSFVKIFPGVSHGWSVRYDVNDETGVKEAEEAHQDMIDWFMKHVK